MAAVAALDGTPQLTTEFSRYARGDRLCERSEAIHLSTTRTGRDDGLRRQAVAVTD